MPVEKKSLTEAANIFFLIKKYSLKEHFSYSGIDECCNKKSIAMTDYQTELKNVTINNDVKGEVYIGAKRPIKQ